MSHTSDFLKSCLIKMQSLTLAIFCEDLHLHTSKVYDVVTLVNLWNMVISRIRSSAEYGHQRNIVISGIQSVDNPQHLTSALLLYTALGGLICTINFQWYHSNCKNLENCHVILFYIFYILQITWKSLDDPWRVWQHPAQCSKGQGLGEYYSGTCPAQNDKHKYTKNFVLEYYSSTDFPVLVLRFSVLAATLAGAHLNIKMSSYQYSYSH